MNKKLIIITLVILVVLVCWYFFAPIKWTFGLRPPRNYQECIDAGGLIKYKKNESIWGDQYCTQKNKEFQEQWMGQGPLNNN